MRRLEAVGQAVLCAAGRDVVRDVCETFEASRRVGLPLVPGREQRFDLAEALRREQTGSAEVCRPV